MKFYKAIAVVCLTVLVCFGMAQAAKAALPLQDSVRLNDMVITLLMPHIRGAVHEFYEPYLTVAPDVATYHATEITAITGGEEIHQGIYNSHYVVTVEIYPYVGPHLSVGKDSVTLEVNPSGVEVGRFEHLESHQLPSHLQSLVKAPLP